MKEKKLTTWEVLRNRYPENEYVLIQEVSDASGFSRSRSMDFMVINLWESRGLAITGIERKSNRGDWLKELKQPQKQENHFKYCDYFFLITDKDGVAKLEEIPENWGWYHINENQVLKTMKSAPKLSSIPVNRSLLCAMLRRAADKSSFVHTDTLETHIQERAEKINGERNYKLEQNASAYVALREKVDAFESASKLRISNGWDENMPKKMGEVVRLIMNNGVADQIERLKRLQSQVKNIYDTINNNVDLLIIEQEPERSVATEVQ